MLMYPVWFDHSSLHLRSCAFQCGPASCMCFDRIVLLVIDFSERCNYNYTDTRHHNVLWRCLLHWRIRILPEPPLSHPYSQSGTDRQAKYDWVNALNVCIMLEGQTRWYAWFIFASRLWAYQPFNFHQRRVADFVQNAVHYLRFGLPKVPRTNCPLHHPLFHRFNQHSR